jgi:hypothetical protein
VEGVANPVDRAFDTAPQLQACGSWFCNHVEPSSLVWSRYLQDVETEAL